METQRVIAYRCPDCGAAVVGDLNLFILGGKEITLPCNTCGREAGLRAKLGEDNKVYLTVSCLSCPSPHRFCVESKIVFSRDLFVLSCTLTGLNICFIGDEARVEEALEENRQMLLSLCEDAEDEEEDEAAEESASAPPLFDPVLTGQMLYLIREFAQDGKISCTCGEKRIDFRLLPDGFLFSCPSCAAAKVFPAYSESDRARLEDLTEILLDGEAKP